MMIAKTRVLIPVLLLALLLAGCETTGSGGLGPKTGLGALGGAAAGGLLGAAVGGNAAGIAAGTILGGLVGGAIGQQLDAADRRRAQEAARHALEKAP
jgi:surface antigen